MECGFNLFDTMIYLKNSCPFPQKDKYNQIFEYMFVFSKGTPKTFNPLTRKNNYGSFTRKMTHRSKSGEMTNENVNLSKESNSGNVWLYESGYMKSTKDKSSYEHPAIFPDKLAEDHILSWSNAGDTVYDPFTGSGTTLKMAVKNNRHFIGSEISADYCEIAKHRIESERCQLKLEF